MDIRSYNGLTDRLKGADITADISPVPTGLDKDVTPFTVTYDAAELDDATVRSALGVRKVEDDEERITALTPEARLRSAVAGKMEFEDVLLD